MEERPFERKAKTPNVKSGMPAMKPKVSGRMPSADSSASAIGPKAFTGARRMRPAAAIKRKTKESRAGMMLMF